MISESDRIIQLYTHTISELNSIDQNDAQKLTSLVVDFFTRLYGLKNSITLEELVKDISKRSLYPGLRNETIEFIEKLSNLQYFFPVTRMESAKAMADHFKILAKELCNNLLIRKKVDPENRKKTKGIRGMQWLSTPFNLFKRKKNELDVDYDTEQIITLINQARRAFKHGDTKTASEIYTTIMNMHAMLSSHQQKELDFHISKLHEKFRIANKGKK